MKADALKRLDKVVSQLRRWSKDSYGQGDEVAGWAQKYHADELAAIRAELGGEQAGDEGESPKGESIPSPQAIESGGRTVQPPATPIHMEEGCMVDGEWYDAEELGYIVREFNAG